MSQNALSRKVNGNGKVILDTHPESDQHQNQTCSRGSPPAPTHQICWWSMNPFLRYLADKNSAHRQTDTQTDRQTEWQTDRHTPMTTRPCGLRRAGNKQLTVVNVSPLLAPRVAASKWRLKSTIYLDIFALCQHRIQTLKCKPFFIVQIANIQTVHAVKQTLSRLSTVINRNAVHIGPAVLWIASAGKKIIYFCVK